MPLGIPRWPQILLRGLGSFSRPGKPIIKKRNRQFWDPESHRLTDLPPRISELDKSGPTLLGTWVHSAGQFVIAESDNRGLLSEGKTLGKIMVQTLEPRKLPLGSPRWPQNTPTGSGIIFQTRKTHSEKNMFSSILGPPRRRRRRRRRRKNA